MKRTWVALTSASFLLTFAACNAKKNSTSEVNTISRPLFGTNYTSIINGDKSKYTVLFLKSGSDIIVKACESLAAKKQIANNQNCTISLGKFADDQIASYKAEKLGGKNLERLRVSKKEWEDAVAEAEQKVQANPNVQAYVDSKMGKLANLKDVSSQIQEIESKIAAIDKAISIIGESGLTDSTNEMDFFGQDSNEIITFLQFVYENYK